MKSLLKKKNAKIVLCALVAFFLAVIIVVFMDFDLLKSLYNLYYGDSEFGQFFTDIGQNTFENSTRAATLKLVLYRAAYSALPIAIMFFLFFYYRSKKLPEKILNSDFFKENPSMGKIVMFCRYAFGFGTAFLFLMYGRQYYFSTFHNCILGNYPDFFRIIFACLAFLMFTIEWRRLFSESKAFLKNHPRFVIFLFILFISIVSCCLLEFQVGSKMRVLVYLIHINIMYWLILQVALFVLFRRPKLGAIISMYLAYAIGLANDIVFQFRGNYIMYGDLTVVRTAMEVAGNYDYKPKFWFWLSLGLLILMTLFVIFVKLPKRPFICVDTKITDEKSESETDDTVSEDKSSKKKRIIRRVASTIVFEGIIIAFVFITMRTGDFYGKVFGVGWNYNDNVTVVGYIPYFLSNMDSTREIVLDGYSAVKAKQIFDDFSEQKEKGVGDVSESKDVKTPNIIIIQNEAFSDLSIAADIETDQDYMPFIHSMKENTQKGYLNMSITGGPTSNTEFEVLSRSSLQYFPYGSVPYTQYLKQNIPSVVETLKNQDNPYYTVAYHSYYSSGYNRNSVYDFMGFDRKEFENNFMNEYSAAELPRGYMTDEENYNKVIGFFEENQSSGKPFFCFNVTIQGHGGYTGGPYDLGESVKVTNFEATDSINTYLSSIKMSDTAFKKLIEYFEQVDEPTIIFMYGDHQPSMDDDANAKLDEHFAWNNSYLQQFSKYYVPYVMWANFDIEEYDHLKPWGVKVQDWDGLSYLNELSTNYVGSYIMNAAGVELSEYDRYLLDLHKDVPAITAIGVWDQDDYYYESVDASPYADRLKDLEVLQYNLIFDKKNKLTKYFLPD